MLETTESGAIYLMFLSNTSKSDAISEITVKMNYDIFY